MADNVVRQFFVNARAALRDRYRRTLPFGEYVGDRWEKARFLGFGEGSSIYDSALVFDDVVVGRDVFVGPNAILDGSGGTLTIGDHCDISAGVQIYTHDTVDRAVNGGPVAKGDVTIGSHCYIGPNAVIALGVTIGDHVVIGANSFVNRDIPSHTKGHGTPFRATGKA